MSDDQASLDLASRRRSQLTVAAVLVVLACAFAVAAVIGGNPSAIAVVVGTVLTFAALASSRRSWRGASDVWSGRVVSSELPALVRRSVLPSLPVLLISLGVTIGVTIPPLTRLGSDAPAGGNAQWADAVLVLSVVLYVLASAGAALYPLRVKR